MTDQHAGLHTGITPGSVRSRIIRRVRDAIAALPFVGVLEVEGDTEVEQPSADMDSKAYAVLVVGDEEVIAERTGGLVTKAFPVAVALKLPAGAVPELDADGAAVSPAATLNAAEIAAEYCAAIAALYATEDPQSTTGQTWGGLAIDTDELGGGGVGVDSGHAVTTHGFQITYRHWWGDHTRAPDEPAGGSAGGAGGGS